MEMVGKLLWVLAELTVGMAVGGDPAVLIA
jgi:hypothetical protein